MNYKISLIIILSLIVYVLPAASEIYMFIDDNGKIHFTDAPTSSGYQHFLESKPEKKKGSVYENKYNEIIMEASNIYNISFPLLKALIKVESNFDRMAVSRVGAKGLMQIMPENFEEFEINDPYDPRENIMGGARYIKKLLKRFDGRLQMALAAYNAGPSAVEGYRDVPPYNETMQFVDRVMKYYYIYNK